MHCFRSFRGVVLSIHASKQVVVNNSCTCCRSPTKSSLEFRVSSISHACIRRASNSNDHLVSSLSRSSLPFAVIRQIARSSIANVVTDCAKVLYACSVLLCTRSADQMMVFLPGESKNTILPHGMANVHVPVDRLPASLVEMGLRALCAAGDEFYKSVCDMLSDGCLPVDIAARIANGPTTVCGCDECTVPLFTECYFLLLKKSVDNCRLES